MLRKLRLGANAIADTTALEEVAVARQCDSLVECCRDIARTQSCQLDVLTKGSLGAMRKPKT